MAMRELEFKVGDRVRISSSFYCGKAATKGEGVIKYISSNFPDRMKYV